MENGTALKGLLRFSFLVGRGITKKNWSAGIVDLKQTHASIQTRMVELPQEYWWEQTPKEIASVIGTPIDLDAPT